MEKYRMSSKFDLEGLKEMLENPTARIPVGLALDVSGSMNGEPIAMLNRGLQQFLDEIRSDDLTLYSAEIGIVTFGSEAKCIADFNTADRLHPEILTSGGLTCMGEGLQMTLDMLEKRKERYRKSGIDYYQPILVVMSDGYPNGDPRIQREQTERVRRMVLERKLTVIAVGIGDGADMEALAKLSPKNPPVRMDHLQFREFFSWLSRSVSSVSASLPGDEPALEMEELQKLASEPWPTGRL